MDEFGDRMKAYEGASEHYLPTGLPVVARIDGRAFSSFTRGFHRPFDNTITDAMDETLRYLVGNTHASIGYTQSDELTLVWDDPETMMFRGRVQKLASVLAGMATSAFTLAMSIHWPTVVARHPHFDARVWSVPSKVEAANALLWRSQDARKNSVSTVCRSLMSAKAMYGLDQAAMIEAIAAKGEDYYAFSERHRYGVFMRRESEERMLTDAELADIPEKWRPTGPVTRTVVRPLDIGYFGDIRNRVGVVFDNEQPRRNS